MIDLFHGGDNMDVNTIMTLVGSLGFPIVACIAIYLQNNKESERHENEMKAITEALNNNTLALTKLAERMDIDHDP